MGPLEDNAELQLVVQVTNVDEKPAKPAKPTVTAVPGSAELGVAWQKPDLNGGPEITGYEVEYRKEPHGEWTSFSDNVTDPSTTIDRADGAHGIPGASAGAKRRDGQRLVGPLRRGQHRGAHLHAGTRATSGAGSSRSKMPFRLVMDTWLTSTPWTWSPK